MLLEIAQWVVGKDKSGEKLDADHISPILISDNMKVASLERYSETRHRKRMSFNTSDVSSYCKYVKDNWRDGKAPIVTVDELQCTSSAIFNHADNGHCDDVGRCELVPSPMWAELLTGVRKLSQRQVIDWVADWEPWISDAAKMKASFSRLEAEAVGKRSQEEQDFSRERSSMEKINITAGTGEVPSSITVKFEPYCGFEERNITIAISAVVQHGEINLRLRPLAVEAAKKEIAQEFTSIISKQIEFTPLIGEIEPAA